MYVCMYVCMFLSLTGYYLVTTCSLCVRVCIIPLTSFMSVFYNSFYGPTEMIYVCMYVWQKKSWQTFEETSGYVGLERFNKWPNSMTDI